MFKTLLEIFHDALTAIRVNRLRIRYVLKRVAIMLLAAALVEVFIFNFNYFQSLRYQPQILTSQMQGQLPQSLDGSCYRLTSLDRTIEFADLNTVVHNVHIEFEEDQPAQVLTATIHFTDEAHQTYFDSTLYTRGVPDTKIATNVEESQYLNLNAAGEMHKLKIDFGGNGVTYPVTIKKVEINAHCPFTFQTLRYGILVAVIALLYIFRPRSSIYKRQVRSDVQFTNVAVGITVALEIVVLCAFLLYGSNQVGVATATYNAGSWDKHSLINTYQAGGDNAQQYAKLAKAMTEGHFYLDDEPPQWLQEMDDPYDMGARSELSKQTGEKYLFDVAYYEGHYYVYFGVVPCVLFYLPFYLLTGGAFPTAIGVLIAGILFIIGLTQLLLLFARNHFKRVSLGLFLLLQLPLVLCSGILYLFKHPTFYSLPIMCGLMFSVWGMCFWMRGRSAEKPLLYYAAGSLCMALVLGCRPQLMVLSLLAFPLFWRCYITERRMFTRDGVKELSCLLAPYVVVFGLLFAYNYARFGSFANFGANYNLTLNDMTKRGFSIGRIAPALFAYFIQAPNVVGEFPYLLATNFQTTYLGQTVREVTFGGLFACLPILWVLFFAGPILKLRIKMRKTRTVAGAVMLMVCAGLIVAVMDAEMAGILQRYYADFSFLFLAATALLLFIVNENIDHTSQKADLMLRTLIALAAVSLLYSALLCLAPETDWVSSAYPWAYQGLVEMFEFWC